MYNLLYSHRFGKKNDKFLKMPKKFQGENSKAVVARARKAEKAAAEKAIKEKAAEDAFWKEDDKLICKKLQRKVCIAYFSFITYFFLYRNKYFCLIFRESMETNIMKHYGN